MADTDALRQYRRRQPPQLAQALTILSDAHGSEDDGAPQPQQDNGDDRRYFVRELERIGDSLALVISVMKKLEARLVVGGL